MCINIAFIVYFNFTNLLQVPPKVTGVSVFKAVKNGNPTLRLTWTALQNVKNLSEYQVEYRRNGEFNWDNRVSAQPYSTSTLLPALLPGTEYNVRMRAVSAAGEGEWSEVLTETTFDSEFNRLQVQLCHHVTFCNIIVVPVKNALNVCPHSLHLMSCFLFHCPFAMEISIVKL